MRPQKQVVRIELAAMLLALIFVAPSPAWAQSGNVTTWGLRATFAPSWEVPQRVLDIDFLQDYLGTDSDISGSELAIGFVRGRRLGGDWGLAYVRKPLSDDTRIQIETGSACVGFGADQVCADSRDVYTTNGAALHGVELHSFNPWFTIKRRVQIGSVVGIGVVIPSGGTVTKHSVENDLIFGPSGQASIATRESTTTFDTKGFLEDLSVPGVLPIARLELAVTGIVSRNFKVRASGGVNVPGVQKLSVTGIYLFGQ